MLLVQEVALSLCKKEVRCSNSFSSASASPFGYYQLSALHYYGLKVVLVDVVLVDVVLVDVVLVLVLVELDVDVVELDVLVVEELVLVVLVEVELDVVVVVDVEVLVVVPSEHPSLHPSQPICIAQAASLATVSIVMHRAPSL